jgi:NADH dehydrogenase
MQQAQQAARNVIRAVDGQPYAPFHYKNLGNMATIGRNAAVADLPWAQVSGLLAWMLWLFIHILWLIGFRNRLLVLVQWWSAYLTYQRSVRLITGGLSRDDV